MQSFSFTDYFPYRHPGPFHVAASAIGWAISAVGR
jgi:hypothetical protein